MKKAWLYYDYRDLRTDFLLCVENYIREEHDEAYKGIAKSRYYEKKSAAEISEIYQDKDSGAIINSISSRLVSCLESKGWTEEYVQKLGRKK